MKTLGLLIHALHKQAETGKYKLLRASDSFSSFIFNSSFASEVAGQGWKTEIKIGYVGFIAFYPTQF